MFIQRGQKEGVIVDLPIDIIYNLSLQINVELAYSKVVEKKDYSEAELEKVMLQTWKAITV